MLDHAIRIKTNVGLSFRFLLEMGPDVHACGVEPQEERLVLLEEGKAKYSGLHSLRHFYASLCINSREHGGLGLLPNQLMLEDSDSASLGSNPSPPNLASHCSVDCPAPNCHGERVPDTLTTVHHGVPLLLQAPVATTGGQIAMRFLTQGIFGSAGAVAVTSYRRPNGQPGSRSAAICCKAVRSSLAKYFHPFQG